MNRISILDCTLRDGGYINDFAFGQNTIRNIVKKMSKASIDIIECGFLVSGANDTDKTLFDSVQAIKYIIGEKNKNLLYVAMIQYGKISIDEISECQMDGIDGIRVTFHEHEIDGAFTLGKQLMTKGYKVFMQPVGTTTYSDSSLLELIHRINQLNPYAFYLVDTLGTMYKNDLLRMFYLVDHNLRKEIAIGFHSHNNLQLSFANAQELIQLNTPRRLIIDSSVYGMGRGAGNLCTELLTQYVNANFDFQYDNLEILDIIDEYIKPIKEKYKWGYGIAYYIASTTGCHPNYASFLLNKQTLNAHSIFSILNSLDNDRKYLYDKEYIGSVYLNYMNHHVDDSESVEWIRCHISGRKVLLLAPGKSLRDNKQVIAGIDTNEYCIISVNFIPKDIPIEMMFISNIKRFSGFEDLFSKDINIVATSNIITESKNNVHVVDYSSYLCEEQCIADNAGLMCMNLLKRLGVSDILLSGFDGFSKDIDENYYEQSLQLNVEQERLKQMNIAMKQKIHQLQYHMSIKFLSDSLYK